MQAAMLHFLTKRVLEGRSTAKSLNQKDVGKDKS